LLILFLSVIISCSPNTLNDTKNEDTQAGKIYGEGIVSDDPPQAGDYDPETETDTDEETIDTSVEEEMSASHPECSNKIEIWTEPDPLKPPCNFRLMDQNGNMVELYDFEGDVILLDFSTLWCIVCKQVAGHVQELHDQYDPFTAITILTENASRDPASLTDVEDWASEYSITTSPVLVGTEEILGTDPDQWEVNSIPSFFLIDKDFHLRVMQSGWNENTITGHIENLISE